MLTRLPPFRLTGAAATSAAAYAYLVTMVGTTLPTPLYPIYEQRLGFSGLIVTVIFAIYALGVLVALLLLGHASDEVGRRPVLLAGLAFAAASSVVFIVADALGPLLIGRLLSGLSAGIVTGTATAALVDLAPSPGRGTLIGTIVQQGGLGSGPLLAGLLAQFAPDPLRLPYGVHLGLLALAAVAVVLMPEPVADRRGRTRLRIERLSVPREVRGVFARAATASFAAFAVMGLFTALAPSVLAELLHLHSHWLSGVVAFELFAASMAGQLSLEIIAASTGLSVGSGVMVVGSGLIAGALAAGSLVLLLIGAAVAGIGVGMAFRSGLSLVNEASPSAERGAVASSFFVVSYVAISLPIIGIGLAAQATNLRDAGIVFAGLIGVLAFGVMASLARRSPMPE